MYFQPHIVYNQKKTEFFSSRLQKEGAFMSHITKHLGSRIRFYRKILGLTIDDLADAIHKSKSTVSKYEAGLVGLDIDTLFDIAGALQVSVNQLIDCPEPSPQNIFISKGFFSQPGIYYMYHLENTSGSLLNSVIKIHLPSSEKADYTAEFFNHVDSYDNLYRCQYYYHGTVTFSDLYTNFIFDNQTNASEKAFILAVNSLKNNGLSHGLVLGISSSYLVPTTYKAVFSRSPLEDKAFLVHMLQFTKADIAQIKRHHVLLLSDSLFALRNT